MRCSIPSVTPSVKVLLSIRLTSSGEGCGPAVREVRNSSMSLAMFCAGRPVEFCCGGTLRRRHLGCPFQTRLNRPGRDARAPPSRRRPLLPPPPAVASVGTRRDHPTCALQCAACCGAHCLVPQGASHAAFRGDRRAVRVAPVDAASRNGTSNTIGHVRTVALGLCTALCSAPRRSLSRPARKHALGTLHDGPCAVRVALVAVGRRAGAGCSITRRSALARALLCALPHAAH